MSKPIEEVPAEKRNPTWDRAQRAIKKLAPPETFSMIWPTETQTNDFFANMPDIESIRKATEDAIAEGNQSSVQGIKIEKRKVLVGEDDLVSERPAAKKKAGVWGSVPNMPGFSDIPNKG